MLKQPKVDASKDHIILSGFIFSDPFLGSVGTIYKDGYFAKIGNMIAKWCLAYHRKYGKAPGKYIRDIVENYENAAKSDEQKDSAFAAKALLDIIFEKYEDRDTDTQLLLDKAKLRFSASAIKELAKNLDVLLEHGEEGILEAEKMLTDFKRIEVPSCSGDEFGKISAQDITSIMEGTNKPIITLPGKLGKLMNEDLCRESFVAFLGRSKIGKSFLLMELSKRALMNRQNVAMFQAGDLSRNQTLLRLFINLAGRSNREKYCGSVFVPVPDCKHNMYDNCDKRERLNERPLMFGGFEFKEEPKYRAKVEKFKKAEMEAFVKWNMEKGYRPCALCRDTDVFSYEPGVWYVQKQISPLRTPDVVKMQETWQRRWGNRKWKLSCHTSGTLTVSTMRSILDIWEDREGFVPSVVVCDYPDIMGPEPGDRSADDREAINKRWIALRGLSLDYKALVLVCTQADAGSYGADNLTLKNFSNDRRKFDHCTSFWALNQNEYEKKIGVLRVGPLLMRDSDFHMDDQAMVLQALQCGRPLLASL
jgi:hypothetical protein